MTGIEPVLPPTQRYTIKETCGILGIKTNPKTLFPNR